MFATLTARRFHVSQTKKTHQWKFIITNSSKSQFNKSHLNNWTIYHGANSPIKWLLIHQEQPLRFYLFGIEQLPIQQLSPWTNIFKQKYKSIHLKVDSTTVNWTLYPIHQSPIEYFSTQLAICSIDYLFNKTAVELNNCSKVQRSWLHLHHNLAWDERVC